VVKAFIFRIFIHRLAEAALSIQGRPSHGGNEAEIFIIPILGGEILNFYENFEF